MSSQQFNDFLKETLAFLQSGGVSAGGAASGGGGGGGGRGGRGGRGGGGCRGGGKKRSRGTRGSGKGDGKDKRDNSVKIRGGVLKIPGFRGRGRDGTLSIKQTRMWMDMGLEVAEDDKNGEKDDGQCETDGGRGTDGDNGEKDGNQGDADNNPPTPNFDPTKEGKRVSPSIDISSSEDDDELLAKTVSKKGPKETSTASVQYDDRLAKFMSSDHQEQNTWTEEEMDELREMLYGKR